MKLGQIATAKEPHSLSRLRGEVGVGVSPRVIVWREPPPGSHRSMRSDLPRKRPASGRGAANLPPDRFNQTSPRSGSPRLLLLFQQLAIFLDVACHELLQYLRRMLVGVGRYR